MAEPKPSGDNLTNTSTDVIVAVVVVIAALSVLGVYIDDILGSYTGFLDWFYGRNWGTIYLVLAILFSILDLVLIGFIAFTLRRHARLRHQELEGKMVEAHPVLPKDETSQNWAHIRELANSQNPSDWNMAVLRADSLLDDVLMHLGYEGTSLAEKLKIVDPTKLTSLDRVWSAHRLRNMIAHDPMEQHTREAIINALRSYELALKELDMLREEKT